MSKNDFIEINEENVFKRLPVALCLDTSGSMHEYISDLNEAVKRFYEQLKGHPRAKKSVETIVVQFGNGKDRGVDVVSPFTEIEHAKIPRLSANGDTPMGAAIERCLALLADRKQGYKNAGIDYYQPIFVLMTDGTATDSTDNASILLREQVHNTRLAVVSVAFGFSANRQAIEDITGTQPIAFNDSTVFLELFKWLGKSAEAGGETLQQDLDEFLSKIGVD